MRAALVALVRADRDWVPSAAGTSLYLRPTIIATEPFLGVRPAKRFLFFVIASPVGAYHGAESFSPARILVEDNYVRAAVGGLGGVKAGANYIASLKAAEDAKARGYAQVLWTDAQDHTYLEEVGTMNLFVRIGDELVTPPLGGSILGGVTRDSALTLLREWGFAANERAIGMEELIAAHRAGTLREIFGCGTAAVITPVGTLGWKGEDIAVNDGKPGEVSRRLFDAITAIQYGRAPDSARLDDRPGLRWLTSSSVSTICRPRGRSSRRWRRRGSSSDVPPPPSARRSSAFARAHGSEGWASECEAAFARLPVACFVAVERGAEAVIGFACYEATCPRLLRPRAGSPRAARPRRRARALARGAGGDARPRLRVRDHRLGVVGRLLSPGGGRHRDRGLGARHLPAAARSVEGRTVW